MKRALLVAALWMHACLAPAHAADCLDIAALTSGQVAPCSGVLLPADELRHFLRVEDALARAEVEAAASKARSENDATAAAELLRVERDARRECESIRAPPPRPARWYQSPWFAGAVGAVVGSAIVLGAVVATR